MADINEAKYLDDNGLRFIARNYKGAGGGSGSADIESHDSSSNAHADIRRDVNVAQSTADEAKSIADTAKSTADTAKTKADEAYSKAEEALNNGGSGGGGTGSVPYHTHTPADINDKQTLRSNMGLGNTLGPLPIENGGTGAANAESALAALGGVSEDHKHEIDDVNGLADALNDKSDTSHTHGLGDLTGSISIDQVNGTVPVSKGGTGETSLRNLASSLEFYLDDTFLTESSISSVIKQQILNYTYPVGSVYISTKNTHPGSFLGGSWTSITGVFPYFNAGTSTGGTNNVTLTLDELPKHSHQIQAGVCGSNAGWESGGSGDKYWYGSVKPVRSIWNFYQEWLTEKGYGQSFSNMPKYQTFYAWKRIS